ncbi:hypothetical protein DFH09DRAFT_1106194 [Mycena vulgaris]|nr:hypothetical protein DFH09DRAFT_1106194 [Mycena vulgaris]
MPTERDRKHIVLLGRSRSDVPDYGGALRGRAPIHVLRTYTSAGALLEGVLGGDNGTSDKRGWFQCVYTRLGAVWSTCGAVKRVKYLCFNVCGGWLAYGKSGSTGSHYLLCGEVPAEYEEQSEGFVGNSSGWCAKWMPDWSERARDSRAKVYPTGYESQPVPVPSWDANCLWSMSVGIASAFVDASL